MLCFAVLGLDFFILHVPVHNPLVQFVYLCPYVLEYYFYSRICPFSLAALFCEKAAQMHYFIFVDDAAYSRILQLFSNMHGGVADA